MRTSSTLFFTLLLACSSSIRVQDAAVNEDATAPDTSTADASSMDGAEPDAYFGECTVPVDCVLVPESCCGNCGQPSRDDIVSVPRTEVNEQREMACADPVACPECAGQPDPTLLPDCSMGGCTFLDLTPPSSVPPGLSACQMDSDCVIRAAECCECGATITEQTVVALNAEISGGYQAFVCELESSCDSCEPEYPDNLVARCEGEGPSARCVVDNTNR